MKTEKMNLNIILLVAAICSMLLPIYGQGAAPGRTMPAGATGLTEIVTATASEPLLISAIWNNCSISVLQANNETGKFRAALGTSTVDVDLPQLETLSVSFRSGGFVAIQAASDSVKLAIYHAKE